MSADAPTDEPLPDAYESIQDAAFKIMAYVELGLAGITLLALFVSWVYVLLHSRRRLSTLRFLLTMTCGLWVSGLVASHRGPAPLAATPAANLTGGRTHPRAAQLATSFHLGLSRPLRPCSGRPLRGVRLPLLRPPSRVAFGGAWAALVVLKVWAALRHPSTPAAFGVGEL